MSRTDELVANQTLVIYSSKRAASRVCRRLRDHNVIAGVRGERGAWEVFGFMPDKMTKEGFIRLVGKIRNETREY